MLDTSKSFDRIKHSVLLHERGQVFGIVSPFLSSKRL